MDLKGPHANKCSENKIPLHLFLFVFLANCTLHIKADDEEYSGRVRESSFVSSDIIEVFSMCAVLCI